jgi:hypothetical protein
VLVCSSTPWLLLGLVHLNHLVLGLLKKVRLLTILAERL